MLCFSVLLATDYSLDYPLLTASPPEVIPPTSNSGTNTICLPYVPAAGLVKASDLISQLNGASGGGNAVVSISRFVAATDLLQVYTGTLPANDFVLVPGEGYRVQVSETFNSTITGSNDDALSIELLAQGLPDSASGTSDYCPPYNGKAQMASDLRDGINLAASNSVVVGISRFSIATDLLETYTGTSTADDFNLVSGESYRIQVSGDVDFNPGEYELIGPLEAEIEGLAPAPCNFPNDGGVLGLFNRDPNLKVRFKWHGGDDVPEVPPSSADGFTNLVFVPSDTQTDCGGANPQGSCTAAVCPGPDPGATGGDSDGCELITCEKCGCEIRDGLTGFCKGGSLDDHIRCEKDSDCPDPGTQTCQRQGDLPSLSSKVLACNQTKCGGTECGFGALGQKINCCDQHFDDSENEKCEDPTEVRCTPLHPDIAYEFFVGGVSLDNGDTWIDSVADGVIVPNVSVKEINCCEFVCVASSGSSCDRCGPGYQPCKSSETCVSRCKGVCSVSRTACGSISECGLLETCDRECQ